MPVLQEFCEQVIHAYNTRHGEKFCELFAFEDQSPIVIALRREMSTMSEIQCEHLIENNLETISNALSEFVISYIKLLNNSINYSLTHVYDFFQAFYNSSIPVFSSADSNYLLPFIKNLSTTLVVFAFHVDKMENLAIKKMKANGAARLLSKVFNIMLADRSPLQESKRLGIIHITNLAFKIYTKLDITNLCSTFINNLKTGGVELIDFPISQQVTHRYYLGRFSFYKQQLIVAENHFQFAFQHCPTHSWHNKRLILKFLIPTRIIMGKLPSMELLEKYNFKNPYAYLKQAIKRGDIRQFNIIMDQNYHFFTSTWSYLLLKARCPILLWRSCLRRIFILSRQSEEDRVMSFKICFDGLLAAGEQNDLDFYDTENILVSLISQGYLRGYLHHQLQQVVLSKVNPFPPISQIKPYYERYNDEIVEEHLKTNQPMVPNDVQNLIDEPEDHLLTTTTTEQVQQEDEMNGMGDNFDLAFDQAFENQGFQQPAFGMANVNETSTVGQQQQQQGFFSFQQ